MIRTIKIIFFILSVIAIGYLDYYVMSDTGVMREQSSIEMHSITSVRKQNHFGRIHSLRFSDAELDNTSSETCHAFDTRLQRIFLNQHNCSLKTILQHLSRYDSVILHFKSKLALDAPFRSISGLTNYYVYTLRRIII
ncbi:hypothetical protein [uncultured Bacteroides sp.]|uniref:hypothetical protein n=1 Tax=uncultured Bacteroides sp. TaxID=162156 RepID=UPI002AAAF8CD|nr:hypothetical protein [uncultured Bacteroides sp.]